MKLITKEEAIKAGLKKYFTGKPCKQNHISERYAKSKGMCVRCSEIARKKYNSENKENIARLHREWCEKNPKRAHELKIRWAKANPGRVKEIAIKSKEKRKKITHIVKQ